MHESRLKHFLMILTRWNGMNAGLIFFRRGKGQLNPWKLQFFLIFSNVWFLNQANIITLARSFIHDIYNSTSKTKLDLRHFLNRKLLKSLIFSIILSRFKSNINPEDDVTCKVWYNIRVKYFWRRFPKIL